MGGAIFALLLLFFIRAFLAEYVFTALLDNPSPPFPGAISLALLFDKLIDIASWAVILFWILARFSAGCRRLHDSGHSGWWQLLEVTAIGYLVLFIWFVLPSDKAENQYGPTPARG